MSVENLFINYLKKELNTLVTENGAEGYATTGKNLLDMNFKISSYRNLSDESIIVDFKKAWYENKELALKFLFYVRDVREGVGERRLFRVAITSIVDELDENVFDWIMEYGRADDLFVFIGTKLEKDLINFIQNQLRKDIEALIVNKPCSLLAKWMPSINCSSKTTKKLARKVRKELGYTSEAYRKVLSQLREYIGVLERQLCANQWNEVEYEKVPSQANLKYMNAFLKHDKERREKYLEALANGETKINSSVLFPHSIIHKYVDYGDSVKPTDKTLEELWKALPDYVQGNSNILVVRDGSGSMTCQVDNNSSVTALDVATALTMYFSERQTGQFKDKFITFSSQPKLIDLSNYENLHDRLVRTYYEDECSNTNLEKTFALILDVAVKNNLKQNEIPNLLIISDMEFDNATWSVNKDKLFKTIEDKFKSYGYQLPKLIFWNVNSRTNTIPLTKNENGVILVSGFSTAVVKMVLSEQLDPYKALLEILNSERYARITL